MINSTPYDYKTVNVKKESDNEQSLLAFVRQIILQRQKFKEFDNGEWRIVDSKDEVLALLYSDKGKHAFVCYNFSDKAQEFKSPVGIVKLPPYGFKWQKM